jgi:plastocyanin
MRIQALLLGAAVALTIAAPVAANDVKQPVQVAMKHSAMAATAVTISNYKFTPASVTITAGSTVNWTNNGPATHTTTSLATPPVWDSGNLAKGAKYSHTFAKPGTYAYHCSIHPSMKGTVIVTAMKKMSM